MDKLSFIRYEQKSVNSMRESMAVLVVIAHPEKTSFTHSWAKESIKAAKCSVIKFSSPIFTKWALTQ